MGLSDWEKKEIKKKKRKLILKVIGIIILVVGAIIFPLWVNLGVFLSAKAGYNRVFGGHIVMAYEQATFEGTKKELLILWGKMNETYGKRNYDSTFNSIWYWDQTYDNSLRAQDEYLRRIVERVDNYIIQYNSMKLNGQISLLQDWYDQSIRNLREEMKRSGGLDWVISGVWLIENAWYAYTFSYFNLWLLILAISLILGSVFIVSGSDD